MSDVTRPPAMLASDAERERAVALLREAVGEGRLTLEEFSDRAELAQTARTDRELAVLGADLPAARSQPAPGPSDRHLALCSRIERRGLWDLPQRSEYRSLFGTIVLDLTQARLLDREAQLDVFNLFGTVTVIVPEGVRVSVTGGGLFASQVIESPDAPPAPGAPELRIRIAGPGGTLHVRNRRQQPNRLARLLGRGDPA
jgi:hypothetical protein